MMGGFQVYLNIYECFSIMLILIIKAIRFVSVMSFVSVTIVISDISVITPQLLLVNISVNKSYES